MTSFIKFTSLLLLLTIAVSDLKAVAAAEAKGFNVLSQNLTIVYNALERLKLNTYGYLVDDVLLVNNPNPSFDDQKLVTVTYYLYEAQENGFDRFYPSEKITFVETLKQMPLSTLSLITKPTVCFKNVQNDEYLATYLDVKGVMIRIVTANGYTDERTLRWHVSGNKSDLALTIMSDAFAVPQFDNFLWLDLNTQNNEIVSINIDIGLSGVYAKSSSVWKMTPIGDYVTIFNIGTNQYISGTSEVFTFGYHVARADKRYLPGIPAYLWKVIEC